MKPPVDDIVPRLFPKIKPEDGTGDYFQSKVELKHYKNFPEWDVPRNSVAMDLVLARRNLYVSEKRLQHKRRVRVKKDELLCKQWSDLENKETSFKNSFTKFNKFVRENQEKRERAEKKIVDEIALLHKRVSDIAEMRDSIEQLMDVKSKMDQRIKDYRMFEDYLQDVAKSSPMFKNITEILVRYDSLSCAKIDLGVRQEKQLTALENARTDMAKLIEDKSLVLLGLNNQLAELQERYDAAKNNSLLWETLVSRIQDVSIVKTAQMNEVKTSCYNTYKNMCARRDADAKLNKFQFEEQLLFIKKTLRDLQRVYDDSNRLRSPDANSLRVRSGRKSVHRQK